MSHPRQRPPGARVAVQDRSCAVCGGKGGMAQAWRLRWLREAGVALKNADVYGHSACVTNALRRLNRGSDVK
jgi:hypothetical protein